MFCYLLFFAWVSVRVRVVSHGHGHMVMVAMAMQVCRVSCEGLRAPYLYPYPLDRVVVCGVVCVWAFG